MEIVISEHVLSRTRIDFPDGNGDFYHFDILPNDTGTMTHHDIIYTGRFIVIVINGTVNKILPSHSPFTILYPNGNRYEGTVNQQYLPHEHGKLYKINQDGSHRLYYEGNYNNGMRSGQGTIYYTDVVYTGNFVLDKPNGMGEFRYRGGPSAGDRYNGFVRNGRFHGQGTYTFANGKKIECNNFRDSLRGGTCVSTYPDGRQVTKVYQGKKQTSITKNKKRRMVSRRK